MGNDTQLSRRSFISRLATIAGGFVVAGSATELLTGCTGGGGGNPNPLPGTVPDLPPEQRIPVQVQAMLAAFTAATGIGTTLLSINPANAGTIGRCIPANAAQVLLPFYGAGPISDAGQAGTNPVVRTAAQLGLTNDDVQQFIETLRRAGILNMLNMVEFTFTANGQQLCGIAGNHQDGSGFFAFSTLTFPALSDFNQSNPPEEGQSLVGRSCKEFNRAPDGHVHFDIEVGLVVNQAGQLVSSNREVNVPGPDNDTTTTPSLNGLFVRVSQLVGPTPITLNTPQGPAAGVRLTARFTFVIRGVDDKEIILWIRDVVVECAKLPNVQTGGTGGTSG